MSLKREFKRFENEHGGTEARVLISDNSGLMSFLYPDGAFADVPSTGDLSCAVWGIAEATHLSSERQRREIALEVASNVVTYWETKLEKTANTFRALKSTLSRSVHEDDTYFDEDEDVSAALAALHTPNVADVAGLRKLEGLQAEVKNCQRELKNAQRRADRLRPDYQTPAQRRAELEYLEEEQQEVDEFQQQLSKLEI